EVSIEDATLDDEEESISESDEESIEDSIIDFSTLSPLTDATFVIECKRIYAGRQFLSLHSPFFNALFYGDFKEKDQEKIELKDVSDKVFREMLHILYHPRSNIKIGSRADKYDIDLIELGDRYQIKVIVDTIEKYWVDVGKMYHMEMIETIDAMKIIDRYRLLKLQNIFVGRYENIDEFEKIKESEEQLSDLSEGARMIVCAENERKLSSTLTPIEGTPIHLESYYPIACGTVTSTTPYSDHVERFSTEDVDIGGIAWSAKLDATHDDAVSIYLYANISNKSRSSFEWSCGGIIDLMIIDPIHGDCIVHNQYEFFYDTAHNRAKMENVFLLSPFSNRCRNSFSAYITICINRVEGLREWIRNSNSLLLPSSVISSFLWRERRFMQTNSICRLFRVSSDEFSMERRMRSSLSRESNTSAFDRITHQIVCQVRRQVPLQGSCQLRE
ncbi:hypothetical protein PFISCL1PPCAC_20646, partial [Pristionchus fissidentatus]